MNYGSFENLLYINAATFSAVFCALGMIQSHPQACSMLLIMNLSMLYPVSELMIEVTKQKTGANYRGVSKHDKTNEITS